MVSVYPAGKAALTVTFKLGVFPVRPPTITTAIPEGQGTRYKITYVRARDRGQVAPARPCMGITRRESGSAAVDGTAFRIGALPVKVDLSSEGIVGPSAGLAFTLGLMEDLKADLTGGRKVAATGTMSIDGSGG